MSKGRQEQFANKDFCNTPSRRTARLWLLFSFLNLLPASLLYAQTDWKKEWEETVEGAKREGQVNIYISGYTPVTQSFQQDYPQIKVSVVTAPGAQLTARELAERRAGKYLVDIHSGGANGSFNVLYKAKALDPIKPTLILPEVVDVSKWYGGKHAFIDPDGKYIFSYVGNAGPGQFTYNTGMVKPDDFKSYWDLTHPKWKGKIVSLDPSSTGIGATMQFFYFHPELGPEFIKKLYGGMDVTYSKEERLMTDWLAQGKFALCIGCQDASRAKLQGLPVDSFDTSLWKEGGSLTSSFGTLSLVNNAPHPNAAKVFINWYLSRKGQIALQKIGRPADPPNSRRIDIPKDDVPADRRFFEDRRYLDVTRPEWQDMAPIFKLVKETLASSEKK